MPRPERPLFPDRDPLHAFAARLRELRLRAGNPTYGKMARATGRSRSALAEAAGGDKLPKWETVEAYAQACEVGASSLFADWERLQELRELPTLGRALLTEAPPGLTNLSRRPSRYFVGREEAMRRLAQALASGPRGVSIGSAVHGLGGIGKSELALQYAVAHLTDYTPVWWVAADTADNLALDLATLTRSLEPAWPPSASIVDTAAWALRWLRAHRGWLLVLDNVTDADVIEPVLAAAEGQGRVIASSRRDLDWASLGLQPLGLSVLDRQSSVDLLVARSARAEEREAAESLAAALGDLPLALDHAVAYLNERRHVSIADYEQRFRSQPQRVLSTTNRAYPSIKPIDRTWQVSISEIARQDPLAAQLLDVIAYFQPDRIPIDLLVGLDGDEVAVDDALSLAASFTIISRSAEAVSIHRLVQIVIRLGHESTQPAWTAVELLLGSVPGGNPETAVDTWPDWADIIPHIESVQHVLLAANRSTDDRERSARAGGLLSLGGLYLRGQGRYDTALTMLQNAARLAEDTLGPESPQALKARYALAGGLWSAGQFREAVDLGTDVWRAHQRVLGPDHPDTLSAAAYLTIGYREVGRLDEALTLSLTTLDARIRILGPEHPDTLQSRNNTAGCYKALGQHDEALPLYERTAEDRARILGADHFDTLQSLHNLAGGYLAVVRSDEAMELYRSTLRSRQQILGPQHPDTLHTQHNLAEACRRQNREAEAVTLMSEVLGVRTELLGPDHPDTRRARAFLDQAD